MSLKSKIAKNKMKSKMKMERLLINMNFTKKSKMMLFIPIKKEITSLKVAFADKSKQRKRRNVNGNFHKELVRTTIT